MHSYISERLVQDHRNIIRVLTLMKLQCDFLRVDDQDALTLLSNAANYLIHFPGLLHHPLEELVFEEVVERDPAAAALLKQLKDEHMALAADAANLVARVGLLQLKAADGRDELCQVSGEFIVAYDRHIHFEEKEILPLAEQKLSAQKWKEIGAKLSSNEDPLFGRKSLEIYDSLYDALMTNAPSAKRN